MDYSILWNAQFGAPLTSPNPAPEQENVEKRRKRKVSRACLRCKATKSACSDTRPCVRCIRLGVADECVSVDQLKRGPKPKPLNQLSGVAMDDLVTLPSAASFNPMQAALGYLTPPSSPGIAQMNQVVPFEGQIFGGPVSIDVRNRFSLKNAYEMYFAYMHQFKEQFLAGEHPMGPQVFTFLRYVFLQVFLMFPGRCLRPGRMILG